MLLQMVVPCPPAPCNGRYDQNVAERYMFFIFIPALQAGWFCILAEAFFFLGVALKDFPGRGCKDFL